MDAITPWSNSAFMRRMRLLAFFVAMGHSIFAAVGMAFLAGPHGPSI